MPARLAARLVAAVLAGLSCACASSEHGEGSGHDGGLVEIGRMHEVIGEGRSEARTSIDEVTSREHFYGIGSLEGLAGEVTFVDSVAVATGVGPDGSARPSSVGGVTLLFGAHVPEWAVTDVPEDIVPEQVDALVRKLARTQGVRADAPFMFRVDGTFEQVKLHVIHGACPIRARIHGEALPADRRPFELESPHLEGTLIGLYAEDAVGRLTHPASRTHMHLVFDHPETGERVTGHLERAAFTAGATFRVPASHD